jgi:hypothetical protein
MTSQSRVFLISHFSDSQDAYALSTALVQRGFWLADSSVPEVSEKSSSELSQKIQQRIYNELRNASVVLLLLSSRSSDSKWGKEEIAAAQSMGKPLVVVRARGYSGPIPREIAELASIIVEWNAGSVADRIGQMLPQAA